MFEKECEIDRQTHVCAVKLMFNKLLMIKVVEKVVLLAKLGTIYKLMS